MLTNEEIVTIFKDTHVMLEGHFLLTSGRHSDRYMQCARLFENPKYSEQLCRELAAKFQGEKIDLVVGPAIGGIILAYEMSRQLNVPNIFAERQNGVMTIRRGFTVPSGANILVTEDVVTTGGSVREVIDLVEHNGGRVVGVGCMVDRSNGTVDFGRKFEAILRQQVVSYDANHCPLCAAGAPSPIKPGSRNMSK